MNELYNENAGNELHPAFAAAADENADAAFPGVKKEEKPVKLTSAESDLRSTRLRLTESKVYRLPEFQLEEDMLVPDTRPDLEKIVCMTAEPEISSCETFVRQDEKAVIRVSGSFKIFTLYLPSGERRRLISVNNSIPFRYESEINNTPEGEIYVETVDSSLESRVINERKVRITAGAVFEVKEFSDREIELLEGVRNDDLLLKKEKVCFTDLALRRTEIIDIEESIRLKDSLPAPGRILKYDVNVVENHRQMAKGKAVVEAAVYYSILYLPETAESEESAARNTEGESTIPVFFRGKTEFTHFIRLPELKDMETAGSAVNFKVLSSDIGLRRAAGAGTDSLAPAGASAQPGAVSSDPAPVSDARGGSFVITASIAAELQLYRSIEREIVTDMYHRTKEIEFSSASFEISELCGTASAEITVRDMLSIPESRGSAASVPYISVKPTGVTATAENNRVTVEGRLQLDILFTDETAGEIAEWRTAVPFRTSCELAGVLPSGRTECSMSLKDIWFDRVNSQQIDFNCGIALKISAWNRFPGSFIDKVCYVETDEEPSAASGITVYMTSPGDTLWSIAKKFRTTVDELCTVNEIEDTGMLPPGSRIIIV